MSSTLQSSDNTLPANGPAHEIEGQTVAEAVHSPSKHDWLLRHRLKMVEDLWEQVLRQECGQQLIDRLSQLRLICSPEGQAAMALGENVLNVIENLDLEEAIRAARERQETDEYKTLYALRAGVESTISQGSRRFDLRRSRYIGLARTHLQQTINATAMNLVRIADWLRKGTPPKRPPGHFARLAPPPSFGLAACDSTATAS